MIVIEVTIVILTIITVVIMIVIICVVMVLTIMLILTGTPHVSSAARHEGAAEGGRMYIWGFGYDSTNYNFRRKPWYLCSNIVCQTGDSHGLI